MSLPIRSTSNIALDNPSKSLLYAKHGFGKTYTARYYAEAYGKGLILSGEAGLKSLQDVEIDYVSFTAWEDASGTDGVAFKDVLKMMKSPDFKAKGYAWIMVDSLTELCDLIFKHYDRVHEKSNGFAVWADYGKAVEGTLRMMRDQNDYHICFTCLAKEEVDANGRTEYWPAIQQSKMAKKVPALFDNVFAGAKIPGKSAGGTPIAQRVIYTDEINGWHGKVRDPNGVVRPMEETSNIVEIIQRIQIGEKK